MDKGYLQYDDGTRRYKFYSDDGGSAISLHCGDTLDVFDKRAKRWKPTRIEMSRADRTSVWYLVGTDLRGTDLDGLRVRF